MENFWKIITIIIVFIGGSIIVSSVVYLATKHMGLSMIVTILAIGMMFGAFITAAIYSWFYIKETPKL